MTAKPKRRQRQKFRVGQVVVGTHSRDYLVRIKYVYKIGNHFRYKDGNNAEWGACNLRPLTAREIGPRPKRRPKGKRT